MPASIWELPQPFPPGAPVRVSPSAPFRASDQQPLRNFLFARENGLTRQPEPDSGVEPLAAGTMLTFLGADADMGWVRDGEGREFWVSIRGLEAAP